MELELYKDPVKFISILWPDIVLYKQQKQILYSLRDNDETFVPAGNLLGKDYIAALASLTFFLTRHPVRIVTTSVDGTQLESVLWGEIRRFIQTCKYPLEDIKGGPVVVNHLHLRKMVNKKVCGLSYLLGRVAAKGEGMLGHHIAQIGDGIPRTLFVSDESSGVEDISYERADTWAQRKLIIGNPFPCINFFKKYVKAGDLRADQALLDNPPNSSGGPTPLTKPAVQSDDPASPPRYYRKIIKIRAEDSPNVRYGLAQRKAGIPPTNQIIIPGVLPYDVYLKRRATWDKMMQCVGLDAEFWEGADALLFPPLWLSRASIISDNLSEQRIIRQARAIGIDPAQGGDKTSMAAVDQFGLIEIVTALTPDTSVIVSEAIAFMVKHQVKPELVLFDSGGGGKQHADRLRKMDYPVRNVSFGEAVTLEPRRGMVKLGERKDIKDTRQAYKNRRAQMYGELRELLDPSEEVGFGLPKEYENLRLELSPIPLTRDNEGRLYLLPKYRRDPNNPEPTLVDLIGHSPDEADALVLAVHAMLHEPYRAKAGFL